MKKYARNVEKRDLKAFSMGKQLNAKNVGLNEFDCTTKESLKFSKKPRKNGMRKFIRKLNAKFVEQYSKEKARVVFAH